MTHLPAGPFEHQLPTVEVGGVALMRHDASGVLFLPQSHGFRAGQVYRYDRRGHNVSVRYAAGTSAIVSIYVLPFAPPRRAAQLREVFETSITDMLDTVSVHGTLDDRRTAFAHAAAGVVPGRRCELSGQVQPGSSRMDCSIVEIFAFRAWLLKIRATCQLASRADLESFLGAWLAASLPDDR